MPKTLHKPRFDSIKRNDKKKAANVRIDITKAAKKIRKNTVNKLLPREASAIEGRDEEFQKILVSQYRKYCPHCRPIYQPITAANCSRFTEWIRKFPGVKKKCKDDDLSIEMCYNLKEGRSWVDQRRSKQIVPLFVEWLDAIQREVDNMDRHAQGELPTDLGLRMVVKLLAKNYHPKSNQSNQTPLICVQSLMNPALRRKLAQFGITYTENKKELSAWVQYLRDHGSLPAGQPQPVLHRPPSPVLSEGGSEASDAGSALHYALEEMTVERNEWKRRARKYECEVMRLQMAKRDLERKLSQASSYFYQQQYGMFYPPPAYRMAVPRTPFYPEMSRLTNDVGVPPDLSSGSSSSSPTLQSTTTDMTDDVWEDEDTKMIDASSSESPADEVDGWFA